MSDSSYHSPPADGEDRNYRTYDGPFSHQATSRRAVVDANTRPGNRKQPQQKEAGTLKAPYLGDQSYQHHASHASVVPAANQKAAVGAGVASMRASYKDAAKAGISHGQAPAAQNQGGNAASLSSAAKIDAPGPAIDSSQGRQRHSMKAMPEDAGRRSSNERRQHVQEMGGQGGINAISGVSAVDQRQLLLMEDYDQLVATAGMAGASDTTIDYRALLRANLDFISFGEDPRGQANTQRARPTRKKNARADKKAKSSSTANKKAKPNRKSGNHEGRRGAVANQQKTDDTFLASADRTSTIHAKGVPHDRRATIKGIRKVNSGQARLATNQHNDPQGLAVCGFASVFTTAATSTRPVEASRATANQMDGGVVTNPLGQGQRQQSQQKVRFSGMESGHSSGAANGHHSYAYPSDQGQQERGGRAVLDETNRKDVSTNLRVLFWML